MEREREKQKRKRDRKRERELMENDGDDGCDKLFFVAA
jgi:hypothetical protein